MVKFGLQRLWGFFWARDLSEDRDLLSFEQHQTYSLHLERATDFLGAARDLCDSRRFEPALFNYREATLELARCCVAARGRTPSAEVADLLKQVRESHGHGLTNEVAQIARGLPHDVSTGSLRRLCEHVDRMLGSWMASVKLRSTREIRLTRWLRISVALLVLTLVPIGFQAYQLYPRNLSYQKAVTASSVQQGKNPAALVDNENYGPPPFLSKRESNPWVMIDLGQIYMVTDARIMGRNDCCTAEYVPLSFEVSKDGKTFVAVKEQTEPRPLVVPWVVTSVMKPARYVRVRSKKTAVLGLTEITVYGRPL